MSRRRDNRRRPKGAREEGRRGETHTEKPLCGARERAGARASHTLVRSHNRSTLGNVVLVFTMFNDSRSFFQL